MVIGGGIPHLSTGEPSWVGYVKIKRKKGYEEVPRSNAPWADGMILSIFTERNIEKRVERSHSSIVELVLVVVGVEIGEDSSSGLW